MKPLHERYADSEPVGVAYVGGTFGVNVYEPHENEKYSCDYVCSWHNGQNEWGYHKHKVHYLASGRAYIRKGSLRIYLDEIMKI